MEGVMDAVRVLEGVRGVLEALPEGVLVREPEGLGVTDRVPELEGVPDLEPVREDVMVREAVWEREAPAVRLEVPVLVEEGVWEGVAAGGSGSGGQEEGPGSQTAAARHKCGGSHCAHSLSKRPDLHVRVRVGVRVPVPVAVCVLVLV